MRLREIGKAEEVLRASFRELNTNMNSWNREFFEGLRCDPCVNCVELNRVVPDNFAATCSLDSSIRTTTLSSWDKKLSDTFNALQFASCLMRINITAEHWTLPWNPIDRPNLINPPMMSKSGDRIATHNLLQELTGRIPHGQC